MFVCYGDCTITNSITKQTPTMPLVLNYRPRFDRSLRVLNENQATEDLRVSDG